jgi:hypothetical protein
MQLCDFVKFDLERLNHHARRGTVIDFTISLGESEMM